MHLSIFKREKDISWFKECNITWYITNNTKLKLEYDWWGHRLKSLGVDIATEDDEVFTLGICPYFFSLYITLKNFKLAQWVSNKIKRKDEKYGNGRSIGISFFESSMWIELWNDPNESRSTDPKWWSFHINFADILFGKQNCTKELLEERAVLIPMPEKAYQGHAKLYKYTWKRPRWFKREVKRVELDIPEGLPMEGKGENAHDCGTNATFSMTTGECNSIPEGVGILVGSVLKDRVKYGGWGDWVWTKPRT